MTDERLPLRRLTSHRLPAPTSQDFHSALRVLGQDDADALWARVTTQAGVPVGSHLLTVPQLEALAAAVAAEPDPAGLVGRALVVRVATYRALSEVDAGALPADWARRSMEQLLRGRVPDTERLAEIADLDLFSPATRADLDKAAQTLTRRFGTRVGLVSIVLDGAQEFAGSHGLDGWMAEVGGTPVEWSFCATTVRTREPYVLSDTGADVLQRSNPLVEKDGIGSYAGAPLITSRGHVLGSCCVLDPDGREYTEADVADLQAMADAVVARLEAGRRSERSAAVPAPRVPDPAVHAARA